MRARKLLVTGFVIGLLSEIIGAKAQTAGPLSFSISNSGSSSAQYMIVSVKQQWRIRFLSGAGSCYVAQSTDSGVTWQQLKQTVVYGSTAYVVITGDYPTLNVSTGGIVDEPGTDSNGQQYPAWLQVTCPIVTTTVVGSIY